MEIHINQNLSENITYDTLLNLLQLKEGDLLGTLIINKAYKKDIEQLKEKFPNLTILVLEWYVPIDKELLKHLYDNNKCNKEGITLDLLNNITDITTLFLNCSILNLSDLLKLQIGNILYSNTFLGIDTKEVVIPDTIEDIRENIFSNCFDDKISIILTKENPPFCRGLFGAKLWAIYIKDEYEDIYKTSPTWSGYSKDLIEPLSDKDKPLLLWANGDRIRWSNNKTILYGGNSN